MSAGFGVRLRRYWVAGILVLAPTALTLWVVWKLFKFFDDILGSQLRARGISVVGPRVRAAERCSSCCSASSPRTSSASGRSRCGTGSCTASRSSTRSTRRCARSRSCCSGPSRVGSFGRVAIVEFPSPGSWGIGFVTSTAAGRGEREDGPEALQPLHPERRQSDDGIPAGGARGEGDLPRHDAGAGDEDDRLGRRARAAGALG